MSIIDFKAAKEKREQKKFDEIVEQALEEDDLIADLSAHAIFDIVDVLDQLGYIVEDNPESIRDILLIDEAIKALMYRTKKVDYPLHKISDSLFEVNDCAGALKLIREMAEDSYEE